MEMINVAKLLAVSSVLSLSISLEASAHPGRTAADGCHYCRTNCDSWGVPWNERHCHGHENTETLSDLITATHNPATHTHEIDHLNSNIDNNVSTEK